MMTPRLLPGRARILLIIRVVDGDGGIDIEVQPFPRRRGRTGSPRAGPGLGAGGADPGQMLGVDPGIDEAPHRGR